MKNKNFFNKQRSILSNKIIEGKEVILTEEALEYVKKQGYNIYEDKRK